MSTKLNRYRNKLNALSIDEFINLDVDSAITYDIMRNGGVLDESSLAIEIYQRLFPWYTRDFFHGETMNTYRKAINYIYGDYYINMSIGEQGNVSSVIKSHTKHVEG